MMQPIDVESRKPLRYEVKIVFTASRTLFGRMIRWVTRSSVSHVFLVIPIWEREFAVEATVGGTRVVPVERTWHNVESVWLIQNVPETTLRAGLLKIVSLLGDVYDWMGSFFLGVMLMLRNWFRVQWRTLRWRTKALKCSELVAVYLNSIGLTNYVAEQIVPDDIRRFVENCNNFRKIG